MDCFTGAVPAEGGFETSAVCVRTLSLPDEQTDSPERRASLRIRMDWTMLEKLQNFRMVLGVMMPTGEKEASVTERPLKNVKTNKKHELTKSEIDYLKKHFPNEPTVDVAERLGRSVSFIASVASKLNLKKTPEFIRNQRIEIGRKISFAWKTRGESKKIGERKRWTNTEIAEFKRLYPTNMNRDLAEYFGVSRASIANKAAALNIKKDADFVSQVLNQGRTEKARAIRQRMLS